MYMKILIVLAIYYLFIVLKRWIDLQFLKTSLLVDDETVNATRSEVLQRSRYRKGSNCQSVRAGKKTGPTVSL